MLHYQITLTPVEYFFFGGEKHSVDLTANYFVESNAYPQQTALLGLLRYYLLLKNPHVFSDNKVTDPIEAAKIIGNESFNYPDMVSFCKIESITPLYFLRDKEKYFFAPLDTGFELNNEFILKRDGKTYNAKEHNKYIHQKLYSENQKNTIALSDIINDVQQAGNEKGEKGEVKEDAYYKQTMKQFANNKWSFAFDIYVDETSGIKEETLFIPFGGERSVFKMRSQKINTPTQFIYPSHKHQRDVYVLFCASDCFIDWKLINGLEFSVNNYVSFRNFRSKTSTGKIFSLPKDKNIEDGQVRSNRYNLLQRGSVLYFKDKESRDKIKAIIENSLSKKIGFNYLLVNN